MVSLLISKTLETKGLSGNVVLIDGSPLFFQKFTETVGQFITSEEIGQNEILATLIRIDYPNDNEEVVKNILLASGWNSKLDVFMKFYETKLNFKRNDSRDYITAILERFKMIQALNLNHFPKLEKSNIKLVTPSDKLVTDIDEAYGLQENSSTVVETILLTGNHVSILETVEIFEYINRIE